MSLEKFWGGPVQIVQGLGLSQIRGGPAKKNHPVDKHFLKFLAISVGNQQRTETTNALQNMKSNLI